MRGNNSEQLRADNQALVAENEHLKRLAVGGDVAAVAIKIISAVDSWIEADQDPTNPESFNASLDPAIDRGIEAAAKEHAGEVFKRLAPVEAVAIAEKTLEPDEFMKVAGSGLMAAFETRPKSTLAALDADIRMSLLTLLVGDEQTALTLSEHINELAVKKTRRKNEVTADDPDIPTIQRIQQQYDNLGYFEMSSLRRGDRIYVHAGAKLNRFTTELIQFDAIVESSRGQNFIRPISSAKLWPFTKLFTLGIFEDGFKDRVMPGTTVDIFYQGRGGDPYLVYNVLRGTPRLHSLYEIKINDSKLKLDASLPRLPYET